MKDRKNCVIDKLGNLLPKLKKISLICIPTIVWIIVFYNCIKYGKVRVEKFGIYMFISFVSMISFFSIVFKKESTNDVSEYRRFDNDIQKVILKRNPIENRKEMEKVLVWHCRREINKYDVSVEKIILALIEQYRGEIRVGEIRNNVTSLVYSLLCCGGTILASFFSNYKDSEVAIIAAVANMAMAFYGFIFLFFGLLMDLYSRKLVEDEKRGNNVSALF